MSFVFIKVRQLAHKIFNFFTMIVFYVVNMVVIILTDPDSHPWPGQEKSFACIPDIVNQTQMN